MDRQDILEEINKVLLNEENNDYSYASLYDIKNVLKNTNNNYLNMINNYELYLNKLIKDSKINNIKVSLEPTGCFNHYSKELNIEVIDENNGFSDLIVLEKVNGKITQKYFNNETIKDRLISKDILLSLANNALKRLYDNCVNLSYYTDSYAYGIEPVNSKFKIDITPWNIGICPDNTINPLLSLTTDTLDYEYDENKKDIMEVIKGKEDEIFKKLFIKIDDCPLWMRDSLTKIRKYNLLMKENNQKEVIRKRK